MSSRSPKTKLTRALDKAHVVADCRLCIRIPTCKRRRSVLGNEKLWPDGQGSQQSVCCIKPDCTARGVISRSFKDRQGQPKNRYCGIIL